MNTKKIILGAAFILPFLFGNAQTLDKSTSKVISSKAAKGSLYQFTDNGTTLDLSYMVKESKKVLEFETYSFDKESLEFVEMKESEKDPREMETVMNAEPQKGGDQILHVYPNLRGKPKLKLGYISYWYHRGHTMQKFVEVEELTPKGDAGEKMFYIHHQAAVSEDNQWRFAGKNYKLNIGDVQLIGHVDDDTKPFYTVYSSMVIQASDLSTKIKKDIIFDKSYQAICGETLPNGHLGIVFRSFTMKDFAKPNASQKIQERYAFSDTYHLKYIQINTEGDVVMDVNMEMDQPESGYTIKLDIVPGENGENVSVVGCTRPLKLLANPLNNQGGPKPVYANNKPIYHTKADKFFVAAIENNTLVFSRTYPVEAMIGNLVLGEGAEQPKDVPSYMGKHGQNSVVGNIYLTNSDKHMIVFNRSAEGQQIMQLNSKGDIEANYMLQFPKGYVLNIDPEIYQNTSGEQYLFSYMQPKVKADDSAETKLKAAEARKCLVFKLDPKAKKIGAPIDITPDSGLDLYDPFYFEDENTLVTLGNGRKKEIVLSRVKL